MEKVEKIKGRYLNNLNPYRESSNDDYMHGYLFHQDDPLAKLNDSETIYKPETNFWENRYRFKPRIPRRHKSHKKIS